MMSFNTETPGREAIDAEIDKLTGGQSIEDFAEGGVQEEEETTGQQFLDFGDKLDNKVGGQKPSQSEIKIKSISRPIKGQLGDTSDNEIITVLMTGRLDALSYVYKRDADGNVVDKTRRHSVTPLAVLPVSPEQADALLGLL